jgi:hypothetical protein
MEVLEKNAELNMERNQHPEYDKIKEINVRVLGGFV